MIDLLGCDHRLTVDEREAVIKELAPELKGKFVYLQTCNRVELYRGDGDTDERLVTHLFRVISGLESKMLGEIHIQGQVKRAYNGAIVDDHVSSGLHRLFQSALRCGKRIRTDTEISSGSASHAHATLVTVKRHFGAFGDTKVLVIGVNELTKRVITFLNYSTEDVVTVCNRTDAKAKDFAQQMSASFLPYDALKDGINAFDIVISATASPDVIVQKEWFGPSHPGKRLLIDLALPRDIAPDCDQLENTFLLNLDDVERAVDESIEHRKKQLVVAEKIIEEEVQKFLSSSIRSEVPHDNLN